MLNGDARFWAAHFRPAGAPLDARFTGASDDDARSLLARFGIGDGEPLERLASLENRVWAAGDWVLKLYRPGRWTRAAIVDELSFLEELSAAGVPVSAPRRTQDGALTADWQRLCAACVARVSGRERRSELSEEEVREVGRLAARIHWVGEERDATHRPHFDPGGVRGLHASLRACGALAGEQAAPYADCVEELARALERHAASLPLQRVHGDLGAQNLFWGERGPVAIDFDDMEVAPELVDLANSNHRYHVTGRPELSADLISEGASADGAVRHLARLRAIWGLLVEGYRDVRRLDDGWPQLAPLFYARRLVFVDAWFASRRHDPAIRAAAGTDFGSDAWWARRVTLLRASLAQAA